MAQHQSTPPPPTTSAELLQAQAELWCHTFSFLKSMALHCAIKLGIPNAINRCGGATSLPELHALLPVAPSKRPCLPRLMRLLAATGIFREGTAAAGEEAAGVVRYHLTAVSRLLVDGDDVDGGDHPCLSQFASNAVIMPSYLAACLRLPEWFENEDGPAAVAAAAATPFKMAHGADYWSVVGLDAELGASFGEVMACDSRFVARIVVRECGEVFAGVRSLVDVGGGDGTMAKAIAKAFPHVRCSVLELPHVVDAMAPDCTAEFVAGDMMDFIPPADAVLLKFVLHDWSDEDCVRILKRSKEAISTKGPKGKVIIIDIVVGSASKQVYEAQLLMDLNMMVVTNGKEREEDKWKEMFMDAGFTHYKINPILGSRSLIEVYP
ncbi:hypothetical protein ACP70R_019959 [Stipagrostis hirtigluma subsp. patula]